MTKIKILISCVYPLKKFKNLIILIFLLKISTITVSATPLLTEPNLSMSSLNANFNPQDTRDIVVLLHGLARTEKSMASLEKQLKQQHYQVINLYYPSRHHAIDILATQFVLPELQKLQLSTHKKLHFITHSMGAIIVRYLAHHELFIPTGRVVMLGPPNHGSEVVDKIGHWKLFHQLNGATGQQLSTAWDSLPNRLGKANFDVGIIAGDRSINWINSFMIQGADDGKVSVENTKLEGMKDFLVLHTTHPMMMKNDQVIQQSLYFLQNGHFQHLSP